MDLKEISRALSLDGLPSMFGTWVVPESKLGFTEKLIGYFDEGYPKSFRLLASPPAVVWIYGEIPTGLNGVGVVGTRNMSPEGGDCTRSVSRSLSRDMDFLVSGLADGVDFLSHEVTLRENVTNVAVLGEGIDNVSGSGRQRLLRQILELGGAVVSEKPSNGAASPGGFVERNRLIAVLSEKLVVPECGIPSGTLHTVSTAFQHEKPVLVAQYERVSNSNAGNRYLTAPQSINLSISQTDWLGKAKLDQIPSSSVRPSTSNKEFVEALRS